MHHLPQPLRLRLPRVLTLAVFALLAVAAPAAAATHPGPDPTASCDQGEFCFWSAQRYGGTMRTVDLRTANPDECVSLPEGFTAKAFANRLSDRYVTVYQDRHCSTHGDFSTYPGGGTYVPRAPYVVRAIQIWN